MNNQTPGPALVTGNRWKVLELGARPTYQEGETLCKLGKSDINLGDSIDNAANLPTYALLAAAYTSYDKAGRALGIDATALAQTLDLAALISAARDALWLIENSTAKQWDKSNEAAARTRLRGALAKLPNA